MIDDFKNPPERPPRRLDTLRSFRPDRSTSGESQPAKIERPAPTFRTPEQVAEEDGTDDELLLPAHADGPKDGGPKDGGPRQSNRFAWLAGSVKLFGRWNVPKKALIAIIAAVLIFGGGSAFALTHHKKPPAKPAAVVKKKAVPPPAPKPILSPLTGLPVTAEQQALPVIGVMIENSPDARPQSGLKDAGVVYEAIAEAGITRFLALYQEAHPGNVGPIRSSRPYYLDWAMAFDAAYAHVGGSPDALQRIKDISVKDLDQFYNPAAYHRVTTRYAPHNVYSSIDQLTELARSKGYDKSTFTPFQRKAEQPYKAPAPAPSPTPSPSPSKTSASKNKSSATAQPQSDTRTPASSVNIGISGAYYNVRYDYDGASNSYKRSEGGAPHIDADSGAQLAPKVVIALAMPYSLMADGYHSSYATSGSGKMFVFQDGTVTTGTWTKGEPKSQFVFNDDAGKPLALDPGQTWITVVGNPAAVTFQ